MGDPHIFAEGRPADQRGRSRTRLVPNRSVRIGTGVEPPHPRAPAARCELRHLALRKTPAVRLNQEEFFLSPLRLASRAIVLTRPRRYPNFSR
jgi:hypothetical protein